MTWIGLFASVNIVIYQLKVLKFDKKKKNKVNKKPEDV